MDEDVRRSPIVYRAVADTLRQRIVDGTYQPGDTLPSVPALTRGFSVGADCIGDALQVLLCEGVVVPDGRRAVLVAPKVEREVVELRSGAVMSVRMPTPVERKRLGIDPGVGIPVVVISAPGEPEVLYAANRVEVCVASGQGRQST